MRKIQPIPLCKVVITHSASDYTYERERVLDVQVRRVENGIDTATVILTDYKNEVRDVTSVGDAIKIYEKDNSDASWNTLCDGIIRASTPVMSLEGWALKLECDGAGFGLFMTACAQEYGTESCHSGLDTIKEILEDTDFGIIPKYVNCILGTATSSGYNYSSIVETITGAINYMHFPYKVSNKCIDDLCDLLTAIKAGNAGPHWRFDPTNGFLLKTIGTATGEWPEYYGGSQSASTLEEGVDFTQHHFETLNPEANYILYYGVLRKPAFDYWTEGHADLWYDPGDYIAITDEATIKKVGAYSLKVSTTQTRTTYYPIGAAAAWDFSKIGSEKNPPTFNFWARIEDVPSLVASIKLSTDADNFFYWFVFDSGCTADQWYFRSARVGDYYRKDIDWKVNGSPSWSNINSIRIEHVEGSCVTYWDDMHFEGLICRAAKNSTNIGSLVGGVWVGNKLKLKTIVDNVGKDDSMKLSDTTGTIARAAYMELLKEQTSPTVGSFVTPIIPDLLPGEKVHVLAKKKSNGTTWGIEKDMRVTRVTHRISKQTRFSSLIEVTDDLKNSHPRSTFGDINRVLAQSRPEWQDRQATSIKASQVDINVPILEVDYAS